MTPPGGEELDRERWVALAQLEEWLETPMVVLGFVWLALLVLELVLGLNPVLDGIGLVIWGLFLIDFVLRFVLAPRKLVFMRSNLLTAASLAVPALRVLRVTRALRLLRLGRAARGVRLLRVVSSMNRGMKALAATLNRRRFGYVVALTVLVVSVGASGMLAFERADENGIGFTSYGEALWWTAMLISTMGSEYWPRTPEGRVLCLLLALYGFAVFGYLTAALASFFIGRDAEDLSGELAGRSEAESLRQELQQLRQSLARLDERLDGGRR